MGKSVRLRVRSRVAAVSALRVPITVAIVLVAVAALAAPAPAPAYKEWNHSTAMGKRSCAVGCHAEQAPTNATCTVCHTGFTSSRTLKCWDCHEPGQATSAWQSATGCATTCHRWTGTTEKPSYTTTFSHGATPHVGASSAPCTTCHGVSAGPASPGTSQHHDAVDSPAPVCTTCHDGTHAAAKTSHAGTATTCAACHAGHDRPAMPASCLTCHSSASHPEAKQIVFTSEMSCTNARCHGAAAVHTATPALPKTCSTCHTAHYQALGGCQTCHPNPQTVHHGTATARPLADCAGCHDGGIASAPAGHGAYGTNCASCHSGMDRPSGDCSSCHVGRTGTTTPQITYTNTLACADAGCHGKVVNHGATPISAAPCSTCHTAHYQALGGCQTCHPNPQTVHHGTATARPLADCAGCHDGGIASAPAGHGAYGTNCASCHSGMDRPSGDCSSCHVGRTGTTTPQITYTNTLACADAGCHGKVVNHGATPISAAPCSTCHTAHYQALGGCQTCHPNPQTVHHGTATARPLADCAGCHDGGIASAKVSHAVFACSICHSGMGHPSVPAVCSQCHVAKRFGVAACTTCHSLTGLVGREQVHEATPKAGVTCATCHAEHYTDLGSCRTCHGRVPEAHHEVVAPLSSALSVQASPARLAAGATAVVSGTLGDAGGVPLAGAQVLLQARRLSATAFSDVAALTTGIGGGFSQLVKPVAGTEYRVVFEGASSLTTVLRPAIVQTTIAVKQTVRLTARPKSVRRGAKVKLLGTVAPTARQLDLAASPVTLRVERKTASGWRRVAGRTVTPRADGAYSWSWRTRKAGSYRVRATAAATPELLAGVSVRVRIRVR